MFVTFLNRMQTLVKKPGGTTGVITKTSSSQPTAEASASPIIDPKATGQDAVMLTTVRGLSLDVCLCLLPGVAACALC